MAAAAPGVRVDPIILLHTIVTIMWHYKQDFDHETSLYM